jgi:hypothetical protein
MQLTALSRNSSLYYILFLSTAEINLAMNSYIDSFISFKTKDAILSSVNRFAANLISLTNESSTFPKLFSSFLPFSYLI